MVRPLLRPGSGRAEEGRDRHHLVQSQLAEPHGGGRSRLPGQPGGRGVIGPARLHGRPIPARHQVGSRALRRLDLAAKMAVKPAMLETLDDRQLAEAARRNSAAFGVLYDRYFARVYRLVSAHTGNQAQTEAADRGGLLQRTEGIEAVSPVAPAVLLMARRNRAYVALSERP